MIQLVNKQHTEGRNAGKWDLYVHAGSEAGDLLLFSQQGYENREAVEELARRLFEGRYVDGKLEEVDLLTKWADGRGEHRPIR